MSFEYSALVNRVVDGDTVMLDVDLGFGIWLRNQSFRLLGINAREKSEAGGTEARTNLIVTLPVGMRVTLDSVKNDKYGGRYDANLILPDGTWLSELLVRTGWAIGWNGSGTRPVPEWPRR